MSIHESVPVLATAHTAPNPSLSVVAPIYNEAENVLLLYDELSQALDKLGVPYELIFVNDGSRDGSWEKLVELANRQPQTVVTIDLRRNFGQTAAISAGIDQARGDVVVLIDADLQNDPADIEMMLRKLDEGFDVVSGWRRARKDKFVTRRIPSMAANALISWVTGVHLHDYGCTLKAYRREVMEEVRLYGEMHRFIPVFASAAGAQITEVVVNHRPRIYGKSKYGLWRTFKVIMDLITVKFLLSYRTTPMYLFGGIGTIFILSSTITLLAAIVRAILNNSSLIRTPLPILAASLFAIGVQSIMLGLTTELLVRTYFESQDKPVYVVRSILREGKQVSKANNHGGQVIHPA